MQCWVILTRKVKKIILALPQILYFIAKWYPGPNRLNYDAIIAITTNIPLTMQLKNNLFINLSIAVDRLQVNNAVQF